MSEWTWEDERDAWRRQKAARIEQLERALWDVLDAEGPRCDAGEAALRGLGLTLAQYENAERTTIRVDEPISGGEPIVSGDRPRIGPDVAHPAVKPASPEKEGGKC